MNCPESGLGKHAGNNGSDTNSGSAGLTKQKLEEQPSTTNEQASTGKIQQATPEGVNPYFVIDTKPTPVNIPGISYQPIKQSASLPEDTEATVHKKAKKKHKGEMPTDEDTQEVKTEDISERMKARIKEREEKRKIKEEKKRKREPADEAYRSEAESPKKKKKAKKAEEEPLPDRTASTKRPSEEDEEGKKKKKKKRKKSKEVAIASDA